RRSITFKGFLASRLRSGAGVFRPNCPVGLFAARRFHFFLSLFTEKFSKNGFTGALAGPKRPQPVFDRLPNAGSDECFRRARPIERDDALRRRKARAHSPQLAESLVCISNAVDHPDHWPFRACRA